MAVNPVAIVGRFFGRFFGSTIGEAAAYGIGGAMQEPIRPLLQELANTTWETATAAGVGRPLSVGDAAGIVAEDVELRAWGVSQAGQDGHTADQFDAMLGEALNAPGIGELFQLWRRGLIGDAGFVHGLRKAKLETRWDGPLEGLRDTLLSSEELANLQQQGFIDPARADSEGRLQGVTPERQQLRFEASGLPPGWSEGLAMLRRGIIDQTQFAEIVRTGHTKTKWTGPLLQLRDQVLSAATYAGLALRGWITRAEMNAGGALTGYSPAQMDLLFKEHGRPATGHQVLVGLRRGGVYDGPLAGIPQPFVDAIRQSNIRPEWTNILWHAVTVYPPLFQLTRLVQAGVIDAATAADWSYKSGEAQEVVTQLETYWSSGTGTTTDPLVRSTRTALVTALRKSYVLGDEDEAAARAILQGEQIAAGTIDSLIGTWNRERSITRKELTPTQLKKAYRGAAVNPATGTPYTKAEVIDELVLRGYSSEDAQTFVEL